MRAFCNNRNDFNMEKTAIENCFAGHLCQLPVTMIDVMLGPVEQFFSVMKTTHVRLFLWYLCV